jgi:Transposase DDE domain
METAFIRNRKLPFELLILSMLNMLRRTIALELYSFFNYLKLKFDKPLISISSSAFTQSRQKLSPDIFIGMNDVLIKEFYSDNDQRVKLWESHRLLSIDGSTIILPYSESLKETYGVLNNQKKTDDVIIARVSVLYDVSNDIVLQGTLSAFKNGEISLAHNHIKEIKKGDILILDRGYPSFELAYNILEKQADFIFRCKHNFSNVTKQFIQSRQNECILEIRPKQHQLFKDKRIKANSSITVRLIRIKLDSGEDELLMTSLTDQTKYPYHIFKDLYYKRWAIETFYNRFKNIISVENFSGLTQQAILQDFNCALFISNVQSLIIEEAQEKADQKEQDRTYEYKINSSISLGFLKNRIIDLFINKGAEKTLEELEDIIMQYTIPIRPGRKNKRDIDKYRQRTNPPMFKNRKTII